MLPNVTQVAVLLSSLAQNEGSDIAIGIGADIWLQLSDYCKKRIKKNFFPNNPKYGILFVSFNRGDR